MEAGLNMWDRVRVPPSGWLTSQETQGQFRAKNNLLWGKGPLGVISVEVSSRPGKARSSTATASKMPVSPQHPSPGCVCCEVLSSANE